MQEERHTKIRAHICGLQHLYREVLVYLADDLDCVADCEVGVLERLVSSAWLYPSSSAQIRTLFRCAVTWPPASIVASSPRSWMTLPMRRTVRFVKESR